MLVAMKASAARRREELFTGLAVTLLLFTSTLDGAIAAGLAAALFVLGMLLFPATRPYAFVAALVALVSAVAILLLR